MSNERCGACSLDAEAREARCTACPCAEKAEVRADAERAHKVLTEAAATLELGLDGTIPMDGAVRDAFHTVYSHLYGEGEALRVLAEGRRHD